MTTNSKPLATREQSCALQDLAICISDARNIFADYPHIYDRINKLQVAVREIRAMLQNNGERQ